MSSVRKAEYALDASALLAVLLNEPGHQNVRADIDRAYIHTVNVAEVIGKLVREGVPPEEAVEMIREINLETAAGLSSDHAGPCGELLARTRRHGLSLGDCVCLTVAAFIGATAITADREWQKLHGQPLGDAQIRVSVIR